MNKKIPIFSDKDAIVYTKPYLRKLRSGARKIARRDRLAGKPAEAAWSQGYAAAITDLLDEN